MSAPRHRLVAVIACLLAAGCTIGPQAEPRTLDVDLDGRSLAIPVDDATQELEPVTFASTIYLVSPDSRLVPVARELRAAPRGAARLRALFEALIGGPTEDEIERGLRSLIPPTSTVRDVALDGTTIDLDVSASFASIGGPAELLAVGQVVLTATTFPGVQDLVLQLDGNLTALPLPDGSLTTEPVTLRQFSELLDPVSGVDDATDDGG